MKNPKLYRLLWLIPLALIGLLLHQARVAYSVQYTLTAGQPVAANVLNLQMKDMVAQTHGLVELEVPLANGQTYHKNMTVPAAWVYVLNKNTLNTLNVPSLDGAFEDVVIDDIARVQFRTTIINIGVLLTFILMISLALIWWQRYLNKHGDPAYRSYNIDEVEPI